MREPLHAGNMTALGHLYNDLSTQQVTFAAATNIELQQPSRKWLTLTLYLCTSEGEGEWEGGGEGEGEGEGREGGRERERERGERKVVGKQKGERGGEFALHKNVGGESKEREETCLPFAESALDSSKILSSRVR